MVKALKSFDRLTPSTRQRIEEALQQCVEEIEGVDPMPPIGRPAPPKEKRVASSKVAPEGEGGEGGDEEGGGKTSAEPVDSASEKELVVGEVVQEAARTMGDGKTRFPSAAWRSWSKALPLDDVDFAPLPLLEVLRGKAVPAEALRRTETFLEPFLPDMPSMLGEEGGSGAALVPFAASAAVVSDGSGGDGGDGKVGEDEGDILSKNAAKKVEEKDDDEAQEVRKSREA